VPSSTPDIDAIKKRGALRCGIPLRTQGFASQNANGVWEGMDVEHCKAIAAAILGEPNVEYVNTDLVNRWTDLDNNKFDVLTRATVTMQREVWIPDVEGTFHFSNPYFYDGLRYGGIPSFVECAENEGEGCTGLKVCTLAGSSHAQIVTDLLFGKAESITFQFEDDFHQSLIDGECNVIAGEMVELSEQTLREAGYEGDYTIGQELLSKEPITFASRTDDYVLKDIITWVFEQLHQSDETGVGIENCENVLLQTELGVNLKKSLRNAVCAVGNYGEVYQRTLEPIVPRSGLNLANDGTTGLLYSHPFGSINIEGPQLNKVSKTVENIRKRGFLNCGINIRAGFASFDPETREYSGFDVDLCNLIASAIFDGVPRVLFTDLPARDRFQILADQEIDVLVRLSTWTIVRDFMEPSSGVGFGTFESVS
jgi:general L-amino acid transport system substrate-binding protein